MCTAGIGWSMLKIRGMWNLFEHDDKIPQEFEIQLVFRLFRPSEKVQESKENVRANS